MEELLLTFINQLKQFSYLGIVLALTIEFVPAELVLPLVGYWVHLGDFNFYLATLAGAIGGTTGPITLYALGYFGGRPFLERYGKYFLIKEKQLKASDHFFEKHGASVAFLGRFVPGVRTLISVPCGVARMNLVVFSLYTFLAMVPITALYIYVGMMLGTHWHDAATIVKEYSWYIVSVLLLGGLGIYFLKKMKKKAISE